MTEDAPANDPRQLVGIGLWARGMGWIERMRRSPHAQRAARASSWSVLGYGSSLTLRFISRLVLAKLLTNAAPMGNIAVVSTILAGLEMISDLGIGINVVQHPQGAEPGFLNTTFTVQIVRSLGIWLLAAALAFPVSWAYHDAQLGPLLLFASLSVLCRGLSSPKVFTLTKSMQLRWPTLLTAASELCAFVVTVAWAFIHPSAWALIGGTVAGALVYAAGSHVVAGGVRLGWDRKLASQIIHFGGWAIVSSGTYFLASRGENLMLKGSVPDVEFGCFAFATMLVSTPVGAVTQLASQVFFPMLSSSVRETGDGGLRRYWQGKLFFTAIAAAIAVGAILVGPAAVRLLRLNSSYHSLGWMVQFLGVRGAMEVFAVPAGTILFACGQIRYSAIANIARLLILLAGLAIALPHGMTAAIWVLVGAPAVAYLTLLPGLRKHMPAGLKVEVACDLAFLGVVGLAAAFEAGYLIR